MYKNQIYRYTISEQYAIENLLTGNGRKVAVYSALVKVVNIENIMYKEIRILFETGTLGT